MIDLYFFDSDCISTFLHIEREDIILSLYNTKIHISSFVYQELMHAPLPISANIKKLVDSKKVLVDNICYGDPYYKEFVHLTRSTENGFLIDTGEASVIALVKHKGGVLASNNLRDVEYYVKKYELKHITTVGIIRQAIKEKIITIDEANSVYKKMKDNGDKLPSIVFK